MKAFATQLFGFLVSSLHVEGQSLYISANSFGLNDAKNACNLAIPAFHFTHGGITVNTAHGDVTDRVKEGDMLWIGYIQTYTAFLYRGCSNRINDIENRIISIQPDPGLCYSFCRTIYIGLQGDTCYCLNNLPTVLQYGSCTRACEYPKNTVCGGYALGIAIYQKVKYFPTTTDIHNLDDKNGSCRAYEPFNKYYFWKECNTFYNLACQRGSNQVKGQNDRLESVSGTWMMLNNICLNHGYFPVEERYSPPQNIDVSTSVWTGRLRSYSIMNISAPMETEQGFRQGYVRLENNKFKLRFDVQRKSIRALCLKDERSLKTTSRMPSNTLNIPVSSGSSNRSLEITKSSSDVSDERSLKTTSRMPSSTLNTPVSSGSSNRSLEITKSSTDVPGAVYVVIPVAMVIVIVVGVVGFLLWKQRRNRERKPVVRSLTNTATLGSDTATHHEDSGVDYDVLGQENIAAEDAAYANACSNNNENEYDISGAMNLRGNIVDNGTGNIYNTFTDDVDNTYDSTCTNKIAAKTDDTYNHIEKSAKWKDDLYNHIGTSADNVEDMYTHIEIDDSRVSDTYNHI